MTKYVIICVDDEKTSLKSLKAELKEAIGNNYPIEIAESGENALELVTELLEDGYEIPLIISDYLMPDIKGDELLRQVHHLSPKTLKVMLTGQATIEAVGNAVKYAKLYRYIAKPWQAEDLKLTVTEAIYSYLQEQKLAEKKAKLQRMNQELEELTRQQAILISQLHENENRLTQFLEAMPVGVSVLDAKGKPYYINAKAQELLGKGVVPNATAQQLSGVYQLYQAGSDREYPVENLPIVRALSGGNVTADNLEIHQGDKIIPLEAWGTPVYDAQGNISYAIAAFQDITQRKQAEAQRNKFTLELFQLNQAFSRFIPRQFLQLLDKKSLIDVQLGESVEKEMSVLFTDIRNFSTISESITPEDNFKLINAYLSRMEPAIIENQGFIDKYIGDAIMALFSGNADDAVKAGISMLQRLTQYNQTRQRPDRRPLKIGIGINTGNLRLGTAGGQHRMDSTAIGEAVNLASWLEELTKDYGVSLLISHDTFSRLREPFDYDLRIIDKVQVNGNLKMMSVFEVFDADSPELREGKLSTKPIFEKALFLYKMQIWEEAAEKFKDCLHENPGDTVAKIYLERCLQEIGEVENEPRLIGI